MENRGTLVVCLGRLFHSFLRPGLNSPAPYGAEAAESRLERLIFLTRISVSKY